MEASSTGSDQAQDTAETAQTLISTDLDFLIPLLMGYPKCYWLWNHRIWLLQQASERCSSDAALAFWQQELVLVGKMHARDSRNFHGWTYRRLVVDALRKLQPATKDAAPSLTEQEFAYTTKLIDKNLSNFSAWHQRSKLLPRLLDERGADAAARRKMFDDELAKIEEPLTIDPYDQSMWYYHQYLMTELTKTDGISCFGTFTDVDRESCLKERLDIFRELIDEIDDCKWVYQSLLDLAMMLKDVRVDSEAVPPQEEWRSWLRRLKELDLLRSGRWRDLARRSQLEG